MASESTKAKPAQADKAEAAKIVYVAGRARYPVRKPGVWRLLGVYATEALAKAACYDKWCCWTLVKHGEPVSLTVTLHRGQVCFENE